MTTNKSELDFSQTSSDSELQLNFQNSGLDGVLDLIQLNKINEALEFLSNEENKVEKHLDELLKTKNILNSQFNTTFDNIPDVGEIVAETQPVKTEIDLAYLKIQDLHIEAKILSSEKLQLDEAEKLVQKGQDLLENIDSLAYAITKMDIETAAMLVKTCLDLLNQLKDPQKYFELLQANNPNCFLFIKPLSDCVVDLAKKKIGNEDIEKVIENHRLQLVTLISSRFDKAVANDDTQSIGMCFKLFPLLNEEILGLDKYSNLLTLKLTQSYKKLKIQTNVEGAFSVKFGSLLDSIVYLIDTNYNLVFKYYGPARVLRIIQHLQLELDNRVVLLLDSFEDDRQIARLQLHITQIESQILLELAAISGQIQKKHGNKLPENSNSTRSMSKGSQIIAFKIQNTSSDQQAVSDIENIDVKAIVKVINELSLMASKGVSFIHYLQHQAEGTAEELLQLDPSLLELYTDTNRHFLDQRRSAIFENSIYSIRSHDSSLKIDKRTGLTNGTQFNLLVQWLTSTYVKFETFSMEQATFKALQLDDLNDLQGWELPINSDGDTNINNSKFFSKLQPNKHKSKWAINKNAALTSSCSGDIFYVLQTSLKRATSIHDGEVFQSLIMVSIDLIKSYYITFLENQVSSGWVYNNTQISKINEANNTNGSRFTSPRSSNDYSRMSKDNYTTNGQATPNSTRGMLGLSGSDWKLNLKNSLTNSTFGSALGLAQTSNEPIANQQRRICVGLNNLDVSISYLAALCDDLTKQIKGLWSDNTTDLVNNTRDDLKIANDAIKSLNNLSSKFSHILYRGISSLINQALKSQVRLALKESYCDIKYVLNDEEFADTMSNNLFLQRIFLKLDQLLKPFKSRLTANNYDNLLVSVIDILVADWDRAILQSKYSSLGGMAYERDVKAVLNYFESISTKNISNKFKKLIQMSRVMTSIDPKQIESIFSKESNIDTAPDYKNNLKDFMGLTESNSTEVDKNVLEIANKERALSLSSTEITQIIENRIELNNA
ncbi:hypothetical protein BB561_000409 [Smittium simulii]|uniref:COG4 transport protein middle alpha-helical bundle domain-containing protein n=1 Tax=Smittium simulii TaxID=133385 RepID=A0A2T9YZB1_9FUNG|nr:hypothetical protein BB561_000409 [Smittium simulii]